MIQAISYHFQSAYIAVSTSADKNMLGILAPAEGVLYVSNLVAYSDLNDSADRVRFELQLSSTALSGGASITPVPASDIMPAFSSVAGGSGSVIGGDTAITNFTADGGARGEAEGTSIDPIDLLVSFEEQQVRIPPGGWLCVIQKFAGGFPGSAQDIRFAGDLAVV